MPTQFSVRARAIALAAGAALALAGCSSAAESSDNGSDIVRSTTNVAGAGVVGNDRDTVGLCPTPAPVDPVGIEGAVRPVGHSEGISEVPADPVRIV